MGQGFYTAFVLGNVQAVGDKDAWHELIYNVAKKHKVQGRTAYESKQRGFGFFIAENGSGISERGDGCEIFSYQSFDLAVLSKEV